MKKLQQLKQAIKNPPPERLAKIEYRSHAYQAIGITFVCIMLIAKGYWYIVFALIFGVGVSYSQGMGAYQRYKAIMKFTQPERLEDFEKDISPSRRRSKIVQSVLGKLSFVWSSIFAVGFTILAIDPNLSRWLLSILYPVVILASFIFIYYFIFYWISYPFYKRKLKEGKEEW